jgi:hypothetical protein
MMNRREALQIMAFTAFTGAVIAPARPLLAQESRERCSAGNQWLDITLGFLWPGDVVYLTGPGATRYAQALRSEFSRRGVDYSVRFTEWGAGFKGALVPYVAVPNPHAITVICASPDSPSTQRNRETADIHLHVTTYSPDRELLVSVRKNARGRTEPELRYVVPIRPHTIAPAMPAWEFDNTP